MPHSDEFNKSNPTSLPKDINTEQVPIPKSVFVAPGARVIGDVRFGQDASVWYNSVIRADINHIEIGDQTNIQDNCTLHVTNDLPCRIENNITIGHGAQIHACRIEEACLIGMGAILLTGVHVGRGSVVSAGAVVKENERIPPFSLIVGVPARLVRKLPESTYETHLMWSKKYVGLAKAHANSNYIET